MWNAPIIQTGVSFGLPCATDSMMLLMFHVLTWQSIHGNSVRLCTNQMSLVVGNMKFLAVASGQENVFSQVEFAMGFMTVLTGKAKHVHYCFFWSQMSVTYSYVIANIHISFYKLTIL